LELQRSTHSAKVLFKKTDVSNWQDLNDLFDFAKAELGSIDIMCNGAGVFEPVRDIFTSGRPDKDMEILTRTTGLVKFLERHRIVELQIPRHQHPRSPQGNTTRH
jgi:NAD(P)-dependent dehydrogenase (short-subunit alcohol dehydrogenase family)